MLPNDWIPADGIKLTDEQKDVVKAIDRNIAIIAGPGTGKTEVLAQKANYLLQTGVCRAPFRILTLCYKVDAASNIRARVKKRCSADLAHRFNSMTVDAFLISLIRRFSSNVPDWLQIKRDFEIVDEIDPDAYRSSLQVDYFPDQYKTNLDILMGDVSLEIEKLYNYAANNNAFDYCMCHTLAYYIVKSNPKVRALFSTTYKYIFLDEFQDMTARHYEILKCLFNNEYNKISAVGDYNQAIMSWAGAIPDIFNKFQDECNAAQRRFSYNFRSTSKIVAFINRVLDVLKPEGYPPIIYKSDKPDDPDSFIKALKSNSVDDEAAKIIASINNIKVENQALTFGDFAVILKQRVSDYLGKVAKSFADKNIFVRNEDQQICKGGLVYRDLMADRLSQLSMYLLKAQLRIISVIELSELHYILSTILSLDLDKPRDIRKLHNFKRKIIKNNFVDPKMWLDCIFDSIEESKIVKKLYRKQNVFDEAKKSILHLFCTCVKDNKDNLPRAIEEYMGVHSVRFMTIHKSKGQEFDTVFFADLQCYSWRSLKQQEQKEEALRCFFVGLSRAKKRLFFTTSTNRYPSEIEDILSNIDGDPLE